MNDLGLRLAWLALQVGFFLVAALILQARAACRGPAAGAWVAALSLGLAAALSAAVFLPRAGREATVPSAASTPSAFPGLGPTGGAPAHPGGGPLTGAGRALLGLRFAWARLEHGVAAPAWVGTWRPWTGVLAVLAVTATSFGLLRIGMGLWAIGMCRRRGTKVDDPALCDLVGALKEAMGCRRTVALYEVRELTTPATAGWLAPVVLLPADWRSWDASERRAVLAHELAHILRGDYAVGLLARLAVALHACHPMVRWMAARLQLQQELAADALGARFAGGRSAYLVALSRLALRTNGPSPSWPARAFLPARGTLIRRIAMLRRVSDGEDLEKPWPGASRFGSAVLLVGLTIGIAGLRGPVLRAAGGPQLPAGPAAVETPFELRYVPEGYDGVVAIRPAAMVRHGGMDRLARLVADALGPVLAQLTGQHDVDTSAPGFLRLDFKDVESVVTGVGFGREEKEKGQQLHRLMVGGVLTIRTAAPFDWLRYLRQWGVGFEEVRDNGRVFYKITGPLGPQLGPSDSCLYLHDDRTVVFGPLGDVPRMAARAEPAAPAYLQGPDWDQVSRALFAVAIDNHDGKFPGRYDLGRTDDAVFLSLFPRVDRWVLGLDDADPMAVRATATCRDGEASQAIARTIEGLRKVGVEALEKLALGSDDADATDVLAIRLGRALVTSLHLEPKNHSLEARAEGFATLSDLVTVIERDLREAKTLNATEEDAPTGEVP
jgi:hypothetical protein